MILAFLQTNVAADPTFTFSTLHKLFTSVKSSLDILQTVSFLAKTPGLMNFSIRDTRSWFNFSNEKRTFSLEEYKVRLNFVQNAK